MDCLRLTLKSLFRPFAFSIDNPMITLHAFLDLSLSLHQIIAFLRVLLVSCQDLLS